MPENLLVLSLVALLPLSAGLVVLQTNPYRAMVIRGVLGAIAALTYTLFGAADIALTEALVGTMLSITLYSITVRSSMTMKLGVIKSECAVFDETLLSPVQLAIAPHHLRLEVLSYASSEELKAALMSRDVHTICLRSHPFLIDTRVNHLYRILQSGLPPDLATVGYIQLPSSHPRPNPPTDLSKEVPT